MPQRSPVEVDRDSVAAGDDTTSHAATFDIDPQQTVAALICEALSACPLASISGGRATWLIDTEGPSRGCIGVVAQQWNAPKLLIPGRTRIDVLYGTAKVRVFFRYGCQADPEAVFEALRSGHGLPPKDGK